MMTCAKGGKEAVVRWCWRKGVGSRNQYDFVESLDGRWAGASGLGSRGISIVKRRVADSMLKLFKSFFLMMRAASHAETHMLGQRELHVTARDAKWDQRVWRGTT